MAENFPCDVQGNCCTWQSTWSLYVLLYLIVSMSQSCIVSYVVCMGFLQSPPEARLWAGLQSEWSLQLARYNPRLQCASNVFCFSLSYQGSQDGMCKHHWQQPCLQSVVYTWRSVVSSWGATGMKVIVKVIWYQMPGFFSTLSCMVANSYLWGAWSWSVDIRCWCRLSIDFCSVIVLKLLRMMK